MATLTASSSNRTPESFDLRATLSQNRLLGLWRLIHGFRASYSGALLVMGLATVLKSANYLLLAYFIDNVLGENIVLGLVALVAAGFVGLALFEASFTFVSRRAAARTAEATAMRVRDYLYDHIQRLSFTYHDNAKTGELIQRATSDVDAVRRFYADQAITAGRILLLFGVNFIGIAILNLRLALISVIVIPIVIVMSLWFFKRISDSYEAFQNQEAKLSTTVQEHLTGVRVVRAFARQRHEAERFEVENSEQYRRGRDLLTLHSVFWPISDILSGGQMIAGLTVAALMVIDGTISVGTFLAYSGMVIWLIWPIRNLGRIIIDMSMGMVSYQRVRELLEEQREPIDEGTVHPETAPKGHIVYRDVSFEYEAEAPVLHDIAFEVLPGQSIALLGATGSGKTTVLSLLPRFYDYSRGHITLDGVELKDYARRYLRQHIGIVEQEPFLFSRTIRENITFGVGREVSDEEVITAARAAAVHEVIESFPEKYETLVGERGVTLSGGQKQRVVIARTLLKNPSILILDDATSSVDTETEGEIRAALRVLMEHRTTFIIAHRIQSVMAADLILVFDHGRIIQRGTHDELMQQDGVYRKIYDLQASIEEELEREIDNV